MAEEKLGGLFHQVNDVVNGVFPPKMSVEPGDSIDLETAKIIGEAPITLARLIQVTSWHNNISFNSLRKMSALQPLVEHFVNPKDRNASDGVRQFLDWKYYFEQVNRRLQDSGSFVNLSVLLAIASQFVVDNATSRHPFEETALTLSESPILKPLLLGDRAPMSHYWDYSPDYDNSVLAVQEELRQKVLNIRGKLDHMKAQSVLASYELTTENLGAIGPYEYQRNSLYYIDRNTGRNEGYVAIIYHHQVNPKSLSSIILGAIIADRPVRIYCHKSQMDVARRMLREVGELTLLSIRGLKTKANLTKDNIQSYVAGSAEVAINTQEVLVREIYGFT